MVKWISQLTSDQLFWVRILVGALETKVCGVVVYREGCLCEPIGGLCHAVGSLRRTEGGYGLVVERVLAKDEAGVRFSLSAQKCIKVLILWIKDKGFIDKSVK